MLRTMAAAARRRPAARVDGLSMRPLALAACLQD